LICTGWGLFELANGAVFWAAFVLLIAALLAWQFRRIDWSKYDEG